MWSWVDIARRNWMLVTLKGWRVNYDLLEDKCIDDIPIDNFLFLYYIQQIDSILPRVSTAYRNRIQKMSKWILKSENVFKCCASIHSSILQHPPVKSSTTSHPSPLLIACLEGGMMVDVNIETRKDIKKETLDIKISQKGSDISRKQ